MSFSIAGKTAIVTGAANGVGLAIARHFASAGANVMFADMDEAKLTAEIGDEADDDSAIQYFAGDLRQKLTVANLLSATISAFDRVDILVNASRQVKQTDPLSSDDESVEELIEQNLMTSLRLSRVVARRMIKQAEADKKEEGTVGSIINLSSIAAHQAPPELLAYSVSTAALEQLTRSLALALAPHRIRVNAVAFGSVMSASLANAIKQDRSARANILDCTPLSRIASPDELADVAQFLAAEGSGFMTGQVLTVDGGRSLVDPVEASSH